MSQTAKQNEIFAVTIVDQLIRQDISYFCLSPGSRSTSLVLAIANHKNAKAMIHYDERGMGFHALGYAKGSDEDAVIVVTSGTAVGNLLPCIMEAHHSHVPLIILTADRPPELRGCSSNQTTDQTKIFQNFTRWYQELPCPNENIDSSYLRSLIGYAAFKAKNFAGPVHLNCMFREPFLQNYNNSEASIEAFIEEKSTKYFPSINKISDANLDSISQEIKAVENGMILIGSFSKNTNLESIYKLAEKLKWPIFADILSQDRTEKDHDNVIKNYDLILKTQEFSKRPDIILHFGDRFVSKKLLSYVKKIKAYFFIGDHPDYYDPAHAITHRLQSSCKDFCERLFPLIDKEKEESSWLESWQAKDKYIQKELENYWESNNQFTESSFMKEFSENFPENFAVFFSNSMPIRDADLFFYTNSTKSVKGIFANRGVSGIDGNIATAIGISQGLKCPLVAVLGDLAALHDLGSLAQIKNSSYPIIFFVMNNGGGGIFSHLPISKNPHFETFFATSHNLDFKHAAYQFGLSYSKLTKPQELAPLLKDIKGSTLIEVATVREENFKTHQEIIKKMLHYEKGPICSPIPS